MLVFGPQNDSAVHAEEEVTNARLLVYAILGTLDVDFDHIQRRFEIYQNSTKKGEVLQNLEEVKRPLYGLQLKEFLLDGIAVFVQMIPTRVKRDYYVGDLTPTARMYVEKGESGVSIFVVSANDRFDTNILMGIIGS